MPATGSTFALHNVRVLEEDGGFSAETDVLVEDGVAAAVGAGLTAPGDAPAYDLRGLWLMPGVFDCHVHIAASTMDERELLRAPVSYGVLEAVVNLRRTLDAGVTHVRDAAGCDAGVKRAVDEGLVPGPRLQLSIELLSQTGGHGDMYSERLGVEPDPLFKGMLATVDGVEGMRVAVRRQLRAGADWIKLCTSGGVMTPHDTPYDAGFTAEEIAAAVAEAGRRHKPVMTHAHGGEGIDLAVAAGVRSIEHGTLLTERQAAAMAKAGCWLVPTLTIIKDLIDSTVPAEGQKPLAPPYALQKVLELQDRFGESVRIARAAGVRIAAGTDFIDRRQHGRNLEEIALLHEAGIPLEDTLLVATSGGAELCGVEHLYGRIAPGYVFDAVVLGEDPSDVSVFRRPETVLEVFKGGAACKTGSELLRERGPEQRPVVE
jgi:imidazolonepropionase-like amidohydrolase